MEVTNLSRYRQQREELRVNELRKAVIKSYKIDPEKVPELTPVINVFINQVLTFENYIKRFQIKSPQ